VPIRAWLLVAIVIEVRRFEADYRGGEYRCSDGVCPEGLACVDQVCVEPGGGIDAGGDAGPIDAELAALTCGDPGVIERGAPRSFSGSTDGALNHVSGSCDSHVFNGPDHVYRITAEAGDDVEVSIDATLDIDAYVIGPTCPAPPATPTCAGGAFASPGVPLVLTSVAAGDLFVIVDSELAAVGGDYELTVQAGP
jgi:hypothetical protein